MQTIAINLQFVIFKSYRNESIVFHDIISAVHVVEAKPERFNSRFWNKMYYASVSHVLFVHKMLFFIFVF